MIDKKTDCIELENGYKIAISSCVQLLSKEWGFNSDNIYLSENYLLSLENSLDKGIEFIYVVVFKNDLPVGKLYFQYIKLTSDLLNRNTFFSKSILDTVFTTFLNFQKTGMLLCGNFFATGTNGFVFNRDISQKDIYLIVEKTSKILFFKQESSTVLIVKEFFKKRENTFTDHFNKTMHKFEMDVNMVLDLDNKWQDFDTYLQSMVTKYRTRTKKVYSNTKEITSKQFSLEEIEKYQANIFQLYTAVVSKVYFNITKLTVSSFYQLKKQLKDKFIFTGYFYNNQLVAFSTATINSQKIEANYVGLNYELNKKSPIYQRILYDYVKLAIQYKSKELHLGRTAETIKSAVGAKPVDMMLYARHSNFFFNNLLSLLLRYIKTNELQIRSPFKKNI